MNASPVQPRVRRRGIAVALGAMLAIMSSLGLWALLGSPKEWIKLHFQHPFDRADRLDLARASRFYDLPRIGDSYRFDPEGFLLNRPGLSLPVEWAEHPRGSFVIATNDVGLREDEPLSPSSVGARVLVAGDSHTSGLVDNRDSFTNRCEAALRTRTKRPELEVLNAGVPYTGPTAYRGVLEKFLDLEPAVFVATLFTGNDFADELRLRYLLDGWSWPSAGPDYRRRVAAGQAAFAAGMAQGFNQAARWKVFPEEAERSLRLAVEAFLGMQRRCDELGLAFVAVLLPTKTDVDPPGAEEALLARVLGLEPEDLAINRRLGERFASALRSQGVEVLDPLEAMLASDEELYWRQDFHLGLAGHRLVGELLARKLGELALWGR